MEPLVRLVITIHRETNRNCTSVSTFNCSCHAIRTSLDGTKSLNFSPPALATSDMLSVLKQCGKYISKFVGGGLTLFPLKDGFVP